MDSLTITCGVVIIFLVIALVWLVISVIIHRKEIF